MPAAPQPAALALFERAALILHAADIEMGLACTLHAAGEYRRALALGTHIAGAHLDVVGRTALYASLLHACSGRRGGTKTWSTSAVSSGTEARCVQSSTRSLKAWMLWSRSRKGTTVTSASGMNGRGRNDDAGVTVSATVMTM